MRSLLKAAVLLGAVAAFLFLLPFGGRTLADRWRGAEGAGDFATRLWAEMKGQPTPARPPAARRPGARALPAEGHTESDRQAVDKLVGEHLADAPRR